MKTVGIHLGLPSWRPIETAPKKGAYLVYQPDFKLGRNTLQARICFNCDAGGTRTTTHWYPLPEPPKEPA